MQAVSNKSLGSRVGGWLVVFGASILAGLSTASARQADPPQQADEPAAAPQSQAGQSATGDAWRFRRHAGLWWYWTVPGRWVYWVDGKWVDYDPKTYAEFRASRAPQTYAAPRRSQGNWGQWGPIRYDRFGNPQYPYSQRSRGMQQLGPVPTPAGVRSLPGWGGER